MTYQRLTSFMASLDFIVIVLVSYDMFILCYTSIRPFLTFQDRINLDCGLRDHIIMRFTSYAMLYIPNLIYFDLLSYLRSYKLNGILAH